MSTFRRSSMPSYEQRQEARLARIAAQCLHSLATPRRGTMSGSTSGRPILKEAAIQSGPYMRAAKALGYCMRCGRPSAGPGGLDFCHADLGKGQSIKTDVRRGWPGCRACHEVVGRCLPKPIRRAVEYLLGALTRACVLEAGTWPARLPMWEDR